MSTLETLVQKTKSKLTGSVGRDRINVLAVAINSTTTSLTCTYDPGPDLSSGSIIEIDFEQMFVLSVTASVLTVIRGWNGTTAAAHLINEVITVEPQFPVQNIFDEIVQELRALPRSLYSVVTTTITFPANINQVDLLGATGEVFRILSADRKSVDGVGYPSFNLSTRLIRNQDTSDFASGYCIAIDGGQAFKRDVTARVTYAKTLTTENLTITSNLQTDVGLLISAEDILTFGAASRLMYDKEALRLDISRQGQSRNALEVPVDSKAKQAQRWRMEAERRISEESTRLLGLYGYTGA